MNFKIKKADIRALDGLNELNKEVQAIHYKIDPVYFKAPDLSDIRSELEMMIKDDKCDVLIAAVNDAILGFVSFRECALPQSGLTNEIPMLFIHHMGVKNIFRKQGIGSALMDAVFKVAKNKNIDRVQLDVWTLNFDAKSFFQKRGYQTINEIMIHRIN